jgi:hypothetical protein
MVGFEITGRPGHPFRRVANGLRRVIELDRWLHTVTLAFFCQHRNARPRPRWRRDYGYRSFSSRSMEGVFSAGQDLSAAAVMRVSCRAAVSVRRSEDDQ